MSLLNDTMDKHQIFLSQVGNEVKAYPKDGTTERQDEDDVSSIMSKLEERMSTDHFKQLLAVFAQHVAEDEIDKPKSRLRTRQSQKSRQQEKRIGLLSLGEFQNILAKVLEVPLNDTQAYESFQKHSEALFRKADIDHNDLISWDEFSFYVMLKFQEQDSKEYGSSLPITSQSKLVRIPNVKETIAKVVNDINPNKYIVISREGILNIVDAHLNVKRYFEMEGTGEEEKGASKRRKKVWVTDSVLMPNANKLVISTTNRELWFYDLSTPAYKAQFLLGAMPAVPICLNYTYDRKNKASTSRLFLGADSGDIHFFTFHSPKKGLFETPFKSNESCWQMLFSDLPAHHKRVSHQVLLHVHSDWIRRITYVRHNDVLISCSSNGKDSLVWRDIEEGKKKTYVFRVSKGIECFDYSKRKNIIVTGGMDHIVRLWDPYVTHKPIALMKGHQTAINDVHIYEATDKIFSFSKDGDLRAWDIKEQWCVQRINLKLPIGNNDHGSSPIFRVSKTRIWLSVENCVVEIRTNDTKSQVFGDTTHSRPLCGALYNPLFHQVITASEESEVSVWDAETGKQMSTASYAYRREELSCICLNNSNERLIMASRNGSMSVWNFSNGHMEYTLKSHNKSEVADVVILPDRNLICAVGWSRRILMYSNLHQEGCVRYSSSWAAFEAHQDDILCVVYCPPNSIATGSFNGEIKLWGLDREKLICIVREGNLSKAAGSTACLIHPVDKMLFLMTRSQHMEPVLVSSSGGIIEFWCLYSQRRSSGSFSATTSMEASVLALCTTSSENVLITGDTTGRISIWDIEHYCRGRGEFSVDQTLSSDHTFISKLDVPRELGSFVAHAKAISTVAVIERSHDTFILSGSFDCTAKLFTMDGHCIGTFGQKNPWNLSHAGEGGSSSSYDNKMHETRKETQNLGNVSNNLNGEEQKVTPGSTPSDRPRSTSSLPKLNVHVPILDKDCISKDIQAFKKNDYYRSRTLILDSISEGKGSWSFLGENYNHNVSKRMNHRRHRRENLPWAEIKSDQFGKEGSPFTPFKALHTSEAKDPVLPQNLPVTPRMLRKGVNLSDLESLEQCHLLKERDASNLAH